MAGRVRRRFIGSGPSSDGYDVAVVGSGLAGLMAAASLAHAGRSVLVAERAEGPGGYARAFERGGYTFDPAVHVIPQAGPDSLLQALFDHLGVGEMMDFRQVGVFSARLPGREFTAPVGLAELTAAVAAEFPGDAKGIEAFFGACLAVQREAHVQPPQLGLAGLDALKELAPTLLRYSRATTAEVMDEYLADDGAKALIAAMWPYTGSPPSRLSFVTFGTLLAVMGEGVYRCVGGFQQVVEALVAALERDGGELLVETPVTRVLVEDGTVTGVELDGEHRVRADVVISNADARATFEQLVGEEHLPPALMKRTRRMKPSLSAFALFAATTLDLQGTGVPHEELLFLHDDHERTYADILERRPGAMWITTTPPSDPALAPDGGYPVTLTSLAVYDAARPWDELAEVFAEQLLDAFEAVVPGLRDSLIFREPGTPLTFERYSQNSGGACYGWENTPAQTGGRRSPRVPGPAGLFLAGHWTQPGSTSLRVLVSGFHTAQAVLASSGSPPIRIDHPDLPPL